MCVLIASDRFSKLFSSVVYVCLQPVTALQKSASATNMVSLARTLGAPGSIVVNTAGGVGSAGTTLTALSKRLGPTVLAHSAANVSFSL